VQAPLQAQLRTSPAAKQFLYEDTGSLHCRDVVTAPVVDRLRRQSLDMSAASEQWSKLVSLPPGVCISPSASDSSKLRSSTATVTFLPSPGLCVGPPDAAYGDLRVEWTIRFPLSFPMSPPIVTLSFPEPAVLNKWWLDWFYFVKRGRAADSTSAASLLQAPQLLWPPAVVDEMALASSGVCVPVDSSSRMPTLPALYQRARMPVAMEGIFKQCSRYWTGHSRRKLDSGGLGAIIDARSLQLQGHMSRPSGRVKRKQSGRDTPGDTGLGFGWESSVTLSDVVHSLHRLLMVPLVGDALPLRAPALPATVLRPSDVTERSSLRSEWFGHNGLVGRRATMEDRHVIAPSSALSKFSSAIAESVRIANAAVQLVGTSADAPATPASVPAPKSPNGTQISPITSDGTAPLLQRPPPLQQLSSGKDAPALTPWTNYSDDGFESDDTLRRSESLTRAVEAPVLEGGVVDWSYGRGLEACSPSSVSVFAVMDGHGGSRAADYCSRLFQRTFACRLASNRCDVVVALRRTIQDLDDAFCSEAAGRGRPLSPVVDGLDYILRRVLTAQTLALKRVDTDFLPESPTVEKAAAVGTGILSRGGGGRRRRAGESVGFAPGTVGEGEAVRSALNSPGVAESRAWSRGWSRESRRKSVGVISEWNLNLESRGSLGLVSQGTTGWDKASEFPIGDGNLFETSQESEGGPSELARPNALSFASPRGPSTRTVSPPLDAGRSIDEPSTIQSYLRRMPGGSSKVFEAFGNLSLPWTQSERLPDSFWGAKSPSASPFDSSMLSPSPADSEDGFLGGDQSGCTVAAAVVGWAKPPHKEATQLPFLAVAWVGDTRVVLIRGSKPVNLTTDHKVNSPAERGRVVSAGGVVKGDRVLGMLAVTRAVGDSGLKLGAAGRQIVTSEAEVRSVWLEPTDLAVVVACDGLWDVLSEDQVAKMVTESCLSAKSCAEALTSAAFEAGSQDNISVTVVFVRDALRESLETMEARARGTMSDVQVSSTASELVRLVKGGGAAPSTPNLLVRKQSLDVKAPSFRIDQEDAPVEPEVEEALDGGASEVSFGSSDDGGWADDTPKTTPAASLPQPITTDHKAPKSPTYRGRQTTSSSFRFQDDDLSPIETKQASDQTALDSLIESTFQRLGGSPAPDQADQSKPKRFVPTAIPASEPEVATSKSDSLARLMAELSTTLSSSSTASPLSSTPAAPPEWSEAARAKTQFVPAPPRSPIGGQRRLPGARPRGGPLERTSLSERRIAGLVLIGSGALGAADDPFRALRKSPILMAQPPPQLAASVGLPGPRYDRAAPRRPTATFSSNAVAPVASRSLVDSTLPVELTHSAPVGRPALVPLVSRTARHDARSSALTLMGSSSLQDTEDELERLLSEKPSHRVKRS
jgi:serine/threonine protein phosphatase PrpC